MTSILLLTNLEVKISLDADKTYTVRVCFISNSGVALLANECVEQMPYAHGFVIGYSNSLFLNSCPQSSCRV